MSQILLAVISITLLMLPASEAHDCFSEVDCCEGSKIQHIWSRLNSTGRHKWHMPSSTECKASSEGAINKRSVSPWEYIEDFDNSRYPQRLWHAQCSCQKGCVSLSSGLGPIRRRIYTTSTLNGNSITVQHETLVFYRKLCPKKSDFYYLKPAMYTVNVSCICVAARRD